MAKFQNNISIKNKKAYFDYEISDEYVAGIQLLGTEVKSIRESKASIKEAYCYFEDGEIFIKGMSISEYSHGGYINHDIYRLRKLLLNRREINKIEKKLKDKGNSLLPLLLFISEKGLIKLKIGLGKGKKLYDKRESLKKQDVKKDIARMLKK
ncbi:SsrA-binding protein SmpB [Flavobacteriales bacterium]|nr:SsrA-binding protein SmpB [Flavobacteriales bacterium]